MGSLLIRAFKFLGLGTPWLAPVNVALVSIVAFGAMIRILAVPGYLPESGDEWGNTVAPLRALYQWGDPETFFHPSLYYYVTAVAYVATFSTLRLAGLVEAEGMADLFLVDDRYFIFAARSVSVLSAVATLWVAYCVGKRIWDRQAGLIAAALLAVMPLHVHYSKTVRVDIFAVLVFTAAFLQVLAILQKPDSSTYRRAGGLTGLAASANYSGGILGLWLWLAHFLRPSSVGSDGGVGPPRGGSPAQASAIAVGTFLLTSPFVLLNFDVFRRNFGFIAGMSLHVHTGWEGRDVLYYCRALVETSPWFFALAGVSAFLLLGFGTRLERYFVSLPIGFLALFSMLVSKDLRFVLPAVPLMCIAVGGLLSFLARKLAPLPFVYVGLVALAYGMVFTSAYQMAVRATVPGHEQLIPPEKPLFDWIEGHVPRHSKIVIESGIAPMLDVLGEEGRFAVELRQALLRVRPNLDHEFIGAIYIGGNNVSVR